MDPTVLAVIVIAALAIVGVAIMVMRSRQRERLRKEFGPEYEHQVEAAGGSRAKADAELLKREKRVEKFNIRPLLPEQRARFLDDWQEVQARFVDDPQRSIALADALVGEVMKARGYPVEDFDQRAADLSVEHPRLVENYRTAHDIAVRHGRGEAGTEDLRKAFIGYRSLFEQLLQTEEAELAH